MGTFLLGTILTENTRKTQVIISPVPGPTSISLQIIQINVNINP